MREIFRYKGKHVLYNTGEVEESDEEKVVVEQPKSSAGADLTPEQMGIVLGSMSDNRISDSVKDLVAQAEAGPELSEEQIDSISGGAWSSVPPDGSGINDRRSRV